MAEIYEPSRVLTEDWREFFLQRKDDLFLLPCADGNIELNGRWMMINIVIVMPLINRGVPITASKHLHLDGIYDASKNARLQTQIVATLESMGYTRRELEHDVIMTSMNMHNLCYTHLGSYAQTMDIDSIARTIIQEGVEDVVQIDYGDLEAKNVKHMEAVHKRQSELTVELFRGDTLQYNVFRGPLLCGALKEIQFHQFAVSAGPRTDTDETMFLRPVVGSFLSGMFDATDLLLESRSAMKSNHYNKTQMPRTSYNIRKIAIQSSVIANIYLGDCGSDVFVTMVPTEATVALYNGCFYKGASGALVELTKERYVDVIEREVEFRNPATCRYTDGYCQVCGGTLTKSFDGMGNIGFLSNVNTGAPVSQQVLSAKHLATTDASEYVIHEELDEVFMSFLNKIYLRPVFANRSKRLAIGFRREDIARLNDLRHHPDKGRVSAKRFSNITYLSMGEVGDDGYVRKIGSRVSMGGSSKIYPHLSWKMLQVIQDHPEDIVEQDKLSWLLLRNIDPEDEIFEVSVVNKSIKQYVEDFSSLVVKEVESFRSVNVFMGVISDMIWSRKVMTHITHISCLVKACLITSKKDFHVPVVTNPDDVMFGTLHRNIAMRSIGGLMAFERYSQVTNKPATYVSPKHHGVFDAFMGYSDDIERMMHHPFGVEDVA